MRERWEYLLQDNLTYTVFTSYYNMSSRYEGKKSFVWKVFFLFFVAIQIKAFKFCRITHQKSLRNMDLNTRNTGFQRTLYMYICTVVQIKQRESTSPPVVLNWALATSHKHPWQNFVCTRGNNIYPTTKGLKSTCVTDRFIH